MIETFKREITGSERIAATIDYQNSTAVDKCTTPTERALYASFVDYWYYSEIGFDNTFEFIQRFNSYWDMNIKKYSEIIDELKNIPAMKTIYNSVDSEVGTDSLGIVANRTDTPNLTEQNTYKGRNVEIQNTTSLTTGSSTRTNNDTHTTKRDNKLSYSGTDTIVYTQGDEIRKLLSNPSFFEGWVHEFDKLFMEVL